MELAPVPRRTSSGERRRLLIGLAVLVPVAALVLLPAVLGLDRVVLTDQAMGGGSITGLGRGSVVLDRRVPSGDLRVGDVITFDPPTTREAGLIASAARTSQPGTPRSSHASDPITRRIVAIRQGVARTRGDASGQHVDPWRLRLDDGSSYPREVLHVPLIGYPFLLPGGWLICTALLVALVLGAAWRTRPRTAAGPKKAAETAGAATGGATAGSARTVSVS